MAVSGRAFAAPGYKFSTRGRVLERDDDSSNRHPAPAYCWSMIFPKTGIRFFGIMLWGFASIICAARPAAKIAIHPNT
jgi:hypothetical protein